MSTFRPETSVKTRYVPVILAIYEQIRQRHLSRQSMYPQFQGQTPFDPTRYGPFVPASNPMQSPLPSYPFGPQLTTPQWLRYEPGLNMVNWNEIHSGSVNPVDNWMERINGDVNVDTVVPMVIQDIFPNNRVVFSPGQIEVCVDKIQVDDTSPNSFRLMFKSRDGSHTTYLKIGILGQTGIVELTPEVLEACAPILDTFTNLTGGDGSEYLALEIGSLGQIKVIEKRQRTSFSISNPLL